MKKLYSLFGVFLLLFITNVHAIVEPMGNTWVHDYGNIISEEAEKEINSRIDSLGGGAQVVVVTVEFFDGYSAEDYAYKLFNEWGIGDKDENNGVLLLVSMGEEEYYYLQGSGLEKKLPSSALGNICDDYLVDDLIDGDYDRAFVNTVDAICDRIDKMYTPTDDEVVNSVDGRDYMLTRLITWMIILFVVILIVAIVFAPKRTRRTTYAPFYMPRPSRHYRPSMPRPHEPRVYHRPSSNRGFSGSSFRSSSSSRPVSRPSRPSSSSRSFGGGRSRGGGGGGSFGKR
ncbi:MAG: TPM domain-containing protein [Erysipelotrichales bacterium]|nr:TPM domain-containing protein [Erysipelotrichales bacterium]